MIRIFLLLWAIALPAVAAVRYVDNAATTGKNDGSSWENAYTNIATLSRQSNGVSPGDTVLIAARAYTNVLFDYNGKQGMLELKGGTEKGGWIRYLFTNGPTHLWCGLKLYGYTEINGGLNQDFRTNLISTYDTAKITNNINLWIDRQTNWYNVGSKGRSVWITATPAIVRWVRMTGSTNRSGKIPIYPKADSSIECFWSNASQPIECAYLWIDRSGHHGSSQSIGGSDPPNPLANFRHINVHHCLIERFQSDVVHPTKGMDFHHSIIRHRASDADIDGDGNCNDTFVITPDVHRIRIYNNLIEPDQNVLAYFIPRKVNLFDFFFYNNIMTPVRPQDRGKTKDAGWFQIEQDLPDGNPYQVHSNIMFLNNTWVLTTNGGMNRAVGFITKNNLAADFNFASDSFWFKNNLVAQTDPTPNKETMWSVALYPYNANNSFGTNNLGYGFIYQSDSLVVDYNLFASIDANNLGAMTWGPKGSYPRLWLATATDIGTALSFIHNSTLVGSVLVDPNYPVYDFRPSSSAVRMAENFTSLSTALPDLNTDIYGVTRSATGPWSAGAIEFSGDPPKPPPVITGQPQDVTIPSKVTFTVTATGDPPLFYQWRKDGFNMSGETKPELFFDPVKLSDEGSYDCRVYNSGGEVISDPATLTMSTKGKVEDE